MDAETLIRTLQLAPLDFEGGYFRETYRSPHSTAIYYLLTPETRSLLHRLREDEVYHFYLGDPVELLELGERDELITLGADLAAGMCVQHVVRAGVWQGSRLRAGGRFALMGTTMAPGFEREGFELGVRRALAERYPARAAEIAALTTG